MTRRDLAAKAAAEAVNLTQSDEPKHVQYERLLRLFLAVLSLADDERRDRLEPSQN